MSEQATSTIHQSFMLVQDISAGVHGVGLALTLSLKPPNTEVERARHAKGSTVVVQSRCHGDGICLRKTKLAGDLSS